MVPHTNQEYEQLVSVLKAENLTLSTCNSDLTARNQYLIIRNEELTKRHDEHVSALQSSIVEMKLELRKSREAHQKEREMQNTRHHEEHIRLSKNIENLTTTIENLSTNIENLSATNENLTTTIENLSATNENLTTTIENLSAKNENLTDSIDNLITSVGNGVDKLLQEHDDLKETITSRLNPLQNNITSPPDDPKTHGFMLMKFDLFGVSELRFLAGQKKHVFTASQRLISVYGAEVIVEFTQHGNPIDLRNHFSSAANNKLTDLRCVPGNVCVKLDLKLLYQSNFYNC